jgi:hypothetical protein
MDFDFNRTMSGLADSELLDIVTTERKKYKEEAILAAENELRKRNISFTDLSESGLPVTFSSNEMNEEKPVLTDIKLPAKGDLFMFIIGIFFNSIIWNEYNFF